MWKVDCACSPAAVAPSVRLKQLGFLPVRLFFCWSSPAATIPVVVSSSRPLSLLGLKPASEDGFACSAFEAAGGDKPVAFRGVVVQWVMVSALDEDPQHLGKSACRIHDVAMDGVLPPYLDDICRGTAKTNVPLP